MTTTKTGVNVHQSHSNTVGGLFPVAIWTSLLKLTLKPTHITYSYKLNWVIWVILVKFQLTISWLNRKSITLQQLRQLPWLQATEHKYTNPLACKNRFHRRKHLVAPDKMPLHKQLMQWILFLLLKTVLSMTHVVWLIPLYPWLWRISSKALLQHSTDEKTESIPKTKRQKKNIVDQSAGGIISDNACG